MTTRFKTVLITGANRGIGLEHALRFSGAGATVFAGVRDPHHATALHKATKDGHHNIIIFPYDAADPHAPALAKTIVMDRPIDLLFANAGIYGGDHQKLGDISAEDFAHTLQVNTIAPLLLANALLGNVEKSTAKVIAFQSSKMGSNAGTSTGAYAYRASKAALNKIATTLASNLKKHGVTVVTLHPGWVKTDMGGPDADISVKESVDGQQKLLAGLTLKHSGGFYNYDGSEIAF